MTGDESGRTDERPDGACAGPCFYGTCSGGPDLCGGCCSCMGGCTVQYENQQQPAPEKAEENTVTEIVPTEDIEDIVGALRHPTMHKARAVSAEQRVYILHSVACLDEYDDLRACPYSQALDRGIDPDAWIEDKAVNVAIVEGELCALGADGFPL